VGRLYGHEAYGDLLDDFLWVTGPWSVLFTGVSVLGISLLFASLVGCSSAWLHAATSCRRPCAAARI